MAIKNKYSDIDLSKYEKGYQASQAVQQAQKLKEQAENAVTNFGKFQYGRQNDYDSALDAVLNRKAFSYDINGDALYQQYKDQYMQQGKLAMADAMGQAAAMTGGYGNSYAASVGNQAYQGYLSQLNNLVPELYNLALSAYNTEGDRLNNNLDVLTADRGTQLSEWTNNYNMLVNDRGYYSDNYNQAYTQDYNKWNDNRTYDTNQYWSEYDAGYQIDRDAIADAQWQKQFDESVRQFNVAQANSARTSQLQAEIDALKKEYEGYLSPEQQKAANSSAVKSFLGSTFTKNELAKRSYSTKIGDETKRFDNYEQYIDALAEKWYNENRLTENEVAYIKGYYGVK